VRDELLLTADLIAEEERMRCGGPGPAMAPGLGEHGPNLGDVAHDADQGHPRWSLEPAVQAMWMGQTVSATIRIGCPT
jgi:hypothetical protein